MYAGFRPPFIEDRYKRDLRYREQVDYACERGIPFSQFAGRVPEDGEPLWLPEDRTVALVWQKMQRSKCSRCGTWDWEWDENPSAWVADFWTCQGCKQVDGAHDRLHDKQKKDGMQVRLFKEQP